MWADCELYSSTAKLTQSFSHNYLIRLTAQLHLSQHLIHLGHAAIVSHPRCSTTGLHPTALSTQKLQSFNSRLWTLASTHHFPNFFFFSDNDFQTSPGTLWLFGFKNRTQIQRLFSCQVWTHAICFHLCVLSVKIIAFYLNHCHNDLVCINSQSETEASDYFNKPLDRGLYGR